MPGLVRGVARTAVVAGTATAVSNRVSRRQANRWSQDQAPPPQQQYQEPPQQYAAPPQQYAPAPPPPQTIVVQQQPAVSDAGDRVALLTQLADLKTQGILTEAEFAAEKAKILAS
jgi:hypothetical protein